MHLVQAYLSPPCALRSTSKEVKTQDRNGCSTYKNRNPNKTTEVEVLKCERKLRSASKEVSSFTQPQLKKQESGGLQFVMKLRSASKEGKIRAQSDKNKENIPIRMQLRSSAK